MEAAAMFLFGALSAAIPLSAAGLFAVWRKYRRTVNRGGRAPARAPGGDG